MPPITPPTILSVECLPLDDWLIVADGAAPVAWTRLGDAATEVEDDVVEEGVVGLLGIAEYNGITRLVLGKNRSSQVTGRTATEARIGQTTA